MSPPLTEAMVPALSRDYRLRLMRWALKMTGYRMATTKSDRTANMAPSCYYDHVIQKKPIRQQYTGCPADTLRTGACAVHASVTTAPSDTYHYSLLRRQTAQQKHFKNMK